jgi:hypothetical protein
VRPAWERSRSFIMSLCTPETLRTPEVATRPKSGTAPRATEPVPPPLAPGRTTSSPCAAASFTTDSDLPLLPDRVRSSAVGPFLGTIYRPCLCGAWRVSKQHDLDSECPCSDTEVVWPTSLFDTRSTHRGCFHVHGRWETRAANVGPLHATQSAQGRLGRRIEAITRERIRRDDRD